MRRLFLLFLLPMVACGTPQEKCIAAATKDIRVLDKLIKNTRSNLDRGYAVRREEYRYSVWQICGKVEGEFVYCFSPETGYRNVPVSIDMNVERAKLNSQLAKRSQLAVQAGAQITACKSTYPET